MKRSNEYSESLNLEIENAYKRKLLTEQQKKDIDDMEKEISEINEKIDGFNSEISKYNRGIEMCRSREFLADRCKGLIGMCTQDASEKSEKCKDDIRKLNKEYEHVYHATRSVPNELITLNVGNELITTMTKTLKTPYFDVLLHSDPSCLPRDENGNIFIDRSPEMFKLILDCLRSDGINPDTIKKLDANGYNELCKEAEYYGAYEIAEKLRMVYTPFASSEITPFMASKLASRCKSNVFELIYKASRDGSQAEVFHSKCDKFYPTLVVVYADGGKIFGCYSEIQWNGTEMPKSVKGTGNEFLFVLKSPNCDGPLIFDAVDPFVLQSKSHGPAFGKTESDEKPFFISDSPDKNNKSNINGFSSSGMFYSQGRSNAVFGISESFCVSDYEVYFVPKWEQLVTVTADKLNKDNNSK